MWRHTSQWPRLAGLDVRALAPLSVWLVHMSWWTFWIAAVGVGVFWYIKRRGFTPTVLMRAARCKIVGRYRPSKNDRSYLMRWRLKRDS